MSFFGSMLAGAGEGLGASVGREADLQERMAIMGQQMAMQHQNRLELQDNREEGKNERAANALALRAELAASRAAAGGGKGNFNLAQQLVEADTPDKQDRLVGLVRATDGGNNAADSVADNVFHRPRMENVQFPMGDDDGNVMPGQSTVAQRAAYDSKQGALSLQRVMAVAMDPAKLKDFEAGNAQGLRNDVVANNTLPKVIGDPTADPSDFNEALSPLDPKAGVMADKNNVYADRTDAIRKGEEAKTDRAIAGIQDRDKRASVESARKTYQADLQALGNATSKNRDALQAQVIASRTRLDSLLQSATTPASGKGAAAPAAAPNLGFTPRNPKAAAAAFKAAQGY